MGGIGRAWWAAAWVVASGCGGAVAEPAPSARVVDSGAPFSYERDETATLSVTATRTTESIVVSCDERADVLLKGGCIVTGDAALVEDMAAGANGWTCAAWSAQDGATLRAWVDCLRP